MQGEGPKYAEPLPSFFDLISNDEDTVLRPIVNITNGISGIVDKVQALLMFWEKKYKHIWEQDKEAYIRRVPNQAYFSDVLLTNVLLTCLTLFVSTLLQLVRQRTGSAVCSQQILPHRSSNIT